MTMTSTATLPVSPKARSTSITASLLATESRYDLLIARLIAAAVLLPHGAQKVFGVWGGFGWSATYGALTDSYGLPGVIAFAVIILELVAPIALALGLFSRAAALSIAVVMAGAATFHFEHGFFMNWFGAQAGEGFQFHLLYIGALVPLIVGGGGRFAIDSLLLRGTQRSA